MRLKRCASSFETQKLNLTAKLRISKGLAQRFPNYESRLTCWSQKESWWVVKSYKNLETNQNFQIPYVGNHKLKLMSSPLWKVARDKLILLSRVA